MSLLSKIKEDFSLSTKDFSIDEYLELCRENSMMYASASERMLSAIGTPNIIDTKLDDRLSRIY